MRCEIALNCCKGGQRSAAMHIGNCMSRMVTSGHPVLTFSFVQNGCRLADLHNMTELRKQVAQKISHATGPSVLAAHARLRLFSAPAFASHTSPLSARGSSTCRSQQSCVCRRSWPLFGKGHCRSPQKIRQSMSCETAHFILSLCVSKEMGMSGRIVPCSRHRC